MNAERVGLVATVVFLVAVVWFVLEADNSAKQAAMFARVEAHMLKQIEENHLENLRQTVCTEEAKKALSSAFDGKSDGGMLLDPNFWNSLAYKARAHVAEFVSVCNFDGELAHVRNAFTGKPMGSFSAMDGYTDLSD